MPSSSEPAPWAVTVEELAGWLARLGIPADAEPTDAARLDRIGLLERLKAAAAARQADLTAALDTSQRAAQKAAGVRAVKIGCGIGA